MSSVVSSSSSCWACATCTLLNPVTKRRCQVCNSRKPVGQQANLFESNNSTVTGTTACRTKTNTRKSKRKAETAAITTTTTVTSSNGNNSSSRPRTAVTASATISAASDKNDKPGSLRKRKKQCFSDDHVGDDDGMIDTTRSGTTNDDFSEDIPFKGINDEIDIYRDAERKKNIHCANNVPNCTLCTDGDDSNKTIVIAGTIDDEKTKTILETDATTCDGSNTSITDINAKEYPITPHLCLDDDINVAEQQKQQQQQDKQSTHHLVVTENYSLIPKMTDFDNQNLQQQKRQQPKNAVINSSHSVDDDEKAPEQIDRINPMRQIESFDHGKKKICDMINSINDDVIEIKTKASSEGENNNKICMERNNCDDVQTTSTNTTISETLSKNTMDGTTRLSKLRANGEETSSPYTTTTASSTEGIIQIIGDTRKEKAVVSRTRNKNNDDNNFDNNNNKNSNDDELATMIKNDDIYIKRPLLETDEEITTTSYTCPYQVTGNERNNEGVIPNISTTSSTTATNITGIGNTTTDMGTIIPTSKVNTKLKEFTDNITIDEVSIASSTEQKKNTDSPNGKVELAISNELQPPSENNETFISPKGYTRTAISATRPLGLESLQLGKDFDNTRHSSPLSDQEDLSSPPIYLQKDNTSNDSAFAVATATIGTTDQQSTSTQHKRLKDNEPQFENSCIVDERKHNPSSTQSQSQSSSLNFTYVFPMSTSFAYTPPGTETQSSQEEMTDDDDNNDDDSSAELKDFSSSCRQEQQQNQQRKEHMYSKNRQRLGVKDKKSLELNDLPPLLPNHLGENSLSSSLIGTDRRRTQVTTANERMHTAVTSEGKIKLNIKSSFRTAVSASTKNRSAMTSRKTMSDPMSLFKTAGTGASISVSKESVEDMEKMLNTPTELLDSRKALSDTSPTTPKFPTTSLAAVASSSTKTSTAMFQTAGTGGIISVSEQRVKEIDRIFNNKSSLSRNESVSRKILVKESTKLPRNCSTFLPSTKISMAMFQTAGIGTTISVSKESIEKAGRMLKPSSSSKKKPRKIPSKRTSTTSKTSIAPISVTKISMAMFKTAGSGAAISVSDEKVEEIGKMLKKKSLSSFKKSASNKRTFLKASVSSRTPTTSFQTPTSNTAVKNRSTGATERNVLAAMAMFQTAGSGAAISVSDEKVEEMERLLKKKSSSSSSINDSGLKRAFSESSVLSRKPTTLFQTPILDTSAKIHSTGATETNVSVSMAMFQTAGSGAAISVSDRKVEEIEIMLKKKSSSFNKELVVSNNGFSGTTSPLRTAIVSFQTPRSDVATENYSLKATEKIVSASINMFQTAGSGTTITVSEERLEDMGRMLNRSSSPNKKSVVKNFNDETVGDRKKSDATKERLCTPLKDAIATPHQHIVKFGSIRRATYGLTPLASSKNNNRDCVLRIIPVAENNMEVDCQVQATVQGQDPHASPKDCNMASRSANVTMSAGDGVLIRKRKGEQNGAITPVPINFSNKLDTPDPFENLGLSEYTPGHNLPNVEDCPTLRDAIRLGVISNCPKVCRLNGVHEVTLSVNCDNALQLRFDSEGFPATFALNDKDDTLVSLGRIEGVRQALVDNGCDSKKLKDAWIRNHTRWIIWKLASYERSFSRYLGGNYLTYPMLIHNLSSRFRKEIIEGVRPAIRKIMNRDIAPSKMMILVVCRTIPSPKSKSDATSQPLKILELSDGWYSMKGFLDKKMSEYVDAGLITVGTKLLVSNARLVGLEEGVDPLDKGDGTSCQNCRAALQFTVNACRLARFNAKLGFVKITNNERISSGRLLVKRISDIVPAGGDTPAIRLFIQRVYPMLYMDKSEHCDPSGSSSVPVVKRQFFTVQEEDTKRREFEDRKLKMIEKLTDRIQAEVEQEVDENSPDVWKQVMTSSRPEEIHESFNDQDKDTFSRWKERRSVLIHSRVREELEAELETETSLTRESKNFQRVMVYSIDPKNSGRESAILTIWQPTEEQVGLLKEGTSVEIHDLAVGGTIYGGNLQLIANSKTVIKSFVFQASSLIEKIGFRHRRFLGMFQVHKLSHEADKTARKKQLDFDVAAVQMHVIEPSDFLDAFTFYVTDETNLILKIHCKKPPLLLKKLLLGEKRFSPYAMRDLLICPFDQEQQCAVAEFRERSSVVMSNQYVERLVNWVSLSSQKDLPQTVAYLRAGLPLWQQTSDKMVSLGYIMGLRTESMDKIYIEVDCCGHGCYEWKLPAHVLHQMISTISVDDLQVSLCPEQEDRISKFGKIGSILRARGILWRFQLSSATINESVVCNATEANKHNIGLLYKTLHE